MYTPVARIAEYAIRGDKSRQFQAADAMAYTCSACDAEFESAAAVTQHMPLHHDTCAVCNQGFDDTDSLRDHIHQTH